MKVIIYTCNVNNYDTRKPVLDIDKNTQYLYYSDNLQSIPGWQVLPITKDIHSDKRKISRYYKTHSHLLPPHDYSIWLDASLTVKSLDVLQYVKNSLGNFDIACYAHGKDNSKRSCIYQEAAACINKLPNDTMNILKQIIKYVNEGFPERYGLRSTGILIRRNTEKVRDFNELWWNEIKNGSHRDQLSQMYTAWKLGIKIGKVKHGTVYCNELAKYHYHIPKLKQLKNRTIHKRVK